jgi:hypothetical protein
VDLINEVSRDPVSDSAYLTTQYVASRLWTCDASDASKLPLLDILQGAGELRAES